MATLSLKLPEELDERLNTAARRASATKSELVREAIRRYLAQATPREGSFGSLAADLAGSVDGPSDLSVNKKHMKAYGV